MNANGRKRKTFIALGILWYQFLFGTESGNEIQEIWRQQHVTHIFEGWVENALAT